MPKESAANTILYYKIILNTYLPAQSMNAWTAMLHSLDVFPDKYPIIENGPCSWPTLLSEHGKWSESLQRFCHPHGYGRVPRIAKRMGDMSESDAFI